MDVVVLELIAHALVLPVFVKILLKKPVNVVKLMKINVNVLKEMTVEIIHMFLILKKTVIKIQLIILHALNLQIINVQMELSIILNVRIG